MNHYQIRFPKGLASQVPNLNARLYTSRELSEILDIPVRMLNHWLAMSALLCFDESGWVSVEGHKFSRWVRLNDMAMNDEQNLGTWCRRCKRTTLIRELECISEKEKWITLRGRCSCCGCLIKWKTGRI